LSNEAAVVAKQLRLGSRGIMPSRPVTLDIIYKTPHITITYHVSFHISIRRAGEDGLERKGNGEDIQESSIVVALATMTSHRLRGG